MLRDRGRLWVCLLRSSSVRVVLVLCTVLILGRTAIESAAAVESTAPALPSPVIRLSLSEAVALFLRQNLDLLIAKYGIESSKGQQITARLFPNPVMQIGNVASFTQGNTLAKTGALTAQAQQLF
ncbi:MAG: hypothetical protein L6Q34_14065, partial [Nitrospira sp.]|nr:hypothetical protein [Nitrospira sp.]